MDTDDQLSEQEIIDVNVSWDEIESGKAKTFDDWISFLIDLKT